jgi:poly(3-hydroxybutyrate) depolymerase
MLRHLYPKDFQDAVANPHDEGALLAFDQTAFFDLAEPRSSLSEVGYLYVPNRCLAEVCRLHVAFHGCRQDVEAVYDDFVRDAGYNRWAAANRIIILYPQTKPWFAPAFLPGGDVLANPNGCWDFWGFSSVGYHGQSGKQMRAVKAMVDRLLGP